MDPFVDDLGDMVVDDSPSDTNTISVIEPTNTWSNW